MIETYYVVRDCCGGVLSVQDTPAVISQNTCETCGDWDMTQYVVRIVRADVTAVTCAEMCDLAGCGIPFSTIRAIDAVGVRNIDIVPMSWTINNDNTMPYGRRC